MLVYTQWLQKNQFSLQTFESICTYRFNHHWIYMTAWVYTDLFSLDRLFCQSIKALITSVLNIKFTSRVMSEYRASNRQKCDSYMVIIYWIFVRLEICFCYSKMVFASDLNFMLFQSDLKFNFSYSSTTSNWFFTSIFTLDSSSAARSSLRCSARRWFASNKIRHKPHAYNTEYCVKFSNEVQNWYSLILFEQTICLKYKNISPWRI